MVGTCKMLRKDDFFWQLGPAVHKVRSGTETGPEVPHSEIRFRSRVSLSDGGSHPKKLS